MESISKNLPTVFVRCFAGAILIAIVVYLYSRYRLNYWKRRGVEQLPDTHWFFGNFKQALLLKSPPGWYLGKLYNQASEHAPYFGFYILQRPCLQIKDPKLIKQVFIQDCDNFSDRYFSGRRENDSIGMRNLFGLRGSVWRYLHAKITPTFTLAKVKKMLPLMLENGTTMMNYLKELDTDGDGAIHVDGQELNSKYATDIIANVGFGMSTDTFNNPDTDYTKRSKLH